MQEKLTKNQHGTRSILLVFVEVTENFDSILSSSGLASWDCFEIWHWSDLPNFWQSSSCWKLRMYLPRWWWCRTPQKGHHHKHHKQENTTNTTKRTSSQTPQTGEHHKHHRTHEKSNPIWIVVGGFFTDQGRLRAEGAEPVVPTEAPQQRAGRRGPLRKFGKGIGDRWDCTTRRTPQPGEFTIPFGEFTFPLGEFTFTLCAFSSTFSLTLFVYTFSLILFSCRGFHVFS